MAQVTFNLTQNDDPDIRELADRELRFYTVTMPIGDDKHVVAEEPAASVYWPNKLSEALREVDSTARRWTLWQVAPAVRELPAPRTRW